MMTASQILADIETLQFDRNLKILPQVDGMTYNIVFSKSLVVGFPHITCVMHVIGVQ